MDVLSIIALLRTGAKAATEAKELWDKVKPTLSSEDEAELRKAVAELQEANDQLYNQTIAKLDEAARRT